MSDLQVSLLIIGRDRRRRRDCVQLVPAVAPAAQARETLSATSTRTCCCARTRRARAAARVEPQLDAAAARRAEPRCRAEPSPAATPPPRSARRCRRARCPPVPGFDPDDRLHRRARRGRADQRRRSRRAPHARPRRAGKRFRVAGYSFADTASGKRRRGLSGGRYAHLRLALQLVSRKGAVDLGALTTFCARGAGMRRSASRRSANCPDIEDRRSRAARDLDAFCADVDIAIGVNVVAAGRREVQRHAHPHARRERRLQARARRRFPLSRRGAAARSSRSTTTSPRRSCPSRSSICHTSGVTLLLDVPRVADGDAALEHHAARSARRSREGLGGTLVDDNRVPLTDNSVRAIQQQLHVDTRARWKPAAWPPGSERALRLFS